MCFLSSRKKNFYAHALRLNSNIAHLIRIQPQKRIETILSSTSKRLRYIHRFIPPTNPEKFEQWALDTIVPHVRSGKCLLYLQMDYTSILPSHTLAFKCHKNEARIRYFDPGFMENADTLHINHLSKSISFSLWYAFTHNQKSYDALYLFSYSDRDTLKSDRLPPIR